MTARSNEEWVSALRGSARDAALEELRAVLLRGLRSALSAHVDSNLPDLEDFVQEALLKILAGLDSFRGESQFTTWAQKIAVRLALTELRRRRWRDLSLEAMVAGPPIDAGEDSGGEGITHVLADTTTDPETQALQSAGLATLQRIIQEKLTERQRQAMTAVRMHGVPLEEVALRMDTNRNSLYKLLHDARQRLQKEMLAEGLSPEELLATFAR
jgi:RNA polymerase sigma-70 factor (ECF subfamily)